MEKYLGSKKGKKAIKQQEYDKNLDGRNINTGMLWCKSKNLERCRSHQKKAR